MNCSNGSDLIRGGHPCDCLLHTLKNPSSIKGTSKRLGGGSADCPDDDPCKAYDIVGGNQLIEELINKISTKSFDTERFVESMQLRVNTINLGSLPITVCLK